MKTTKLLPRQSSLAVGFAVLAAMFTHFAAPTALAVNYYWDSDGATAGFGAAPGTWGTDAFWSTNSTGEASTIFTATTTTNDTANFGTATLNYDNLAVVVADGGVSVNKIVFGTGQTTDFTLSGGTITLGGTSPSITVNNVGKIISSALTLNASTSIVAGQNGATVATLNGAIGGTSNLTFTTAAAGLGTSGTAIGFTLGAASTYSGTTLITAANVNNVMNVKATIADALPVTTVLTLDGGNGAGSGRQVSYDLNGNNQTLAGLANVAGRTLRPQRILNTGGAATTLTISNTAPASSTFGGNINGTGLSVAKKGTGTQTLSAGNTYSGDTTISAGKLQFVVGGNCANSTVILDAVAATNGVSITDNTKSWTCANLTTTAAGVLEFSFSAVTPSTTVSPLNITGAADFTVTPKVSVLVSAGLLPGTYPLITWGFTPGTTPTTADLSISTLASSTAASLSVSGNTLNLVIVSTAVFTVKADNTANLNLGISWVGGVVPEPTGVAKWDGTVTSPNTTVLGADLTWAGIAIENPAGPVTINAGNTLTLGAAALDIDLGAATDDLNLNCALALGGANMWDVTTGRTLTLGGAVSGTNTITKLGAGTAILAGANTYSGNTIVTAGTLQLGASNALPDGSGKGNVTVDGTLDLNGQSEGINGLSGAGTGIIDNAAAGTTSTLTAGGNDQTSTFSGVIQNSGSTATLNLTKTGTGMLTLSGANTFTGSTTVSNGTLIVGNGAALGGTTGITLAGGTWLTPGLSGISISAPITLAAAGTNATITAPSVAGSGTTPVPVTLNGAIGGAGDVIFMGINAANAYGTINLNAASDYQGSTLITTASGYGGGPSNNAMIFVKLGAANALPATTVLTLDGGNGGGSGRFCDLNLNGNDQTLAGLTNVPGRTQRTQRVHNTSGTPATLTVSNSSDYTFSGLLGNGGVNLGLTKSGSGVLTLSGNNLYANGTTIDGGTLLVNNSAGSGTGPGDVTVNSGGTLGGKGILTGNVTVNSSGALAPGASIGTLTVSGNLVLSANSTNTFEVNGSTATNDVVVLGAAVTYGGVLKIVPTGLFTVGQAFELFSGAGAADASNFDSISVSSGGGLSFLFTNGVLTVLSAPAPQPAIASVTVSGTNLVVSVPTVLGANYVLQSATNLTPAINWSNVSTNVGTGANLILNVPIEPGKPQKFLRFWVD